VIAERNPVFRAISMVGTIDIPRVETEMFSRERTSEVPANPAVFSASGRVNVNSKWPSSSVLVASVLSPVRIQRTG